MSFVTSDLPEGLRLRVVHLHKDNSSRKQRKNSLYRTIARIVNTDDEVLAEASSKCHSELDFPNRKQGYQVAVGRVKKALYKAFPEYITV